jgi:Zn-dependent protease with chaperone function
MHRGSTAPGVRAALVCAGPVLVGLAQIQLARQQEYAADRCAVSRIRGLTVCILLR